MDQIEIRRTELTDLAELQRIAKQTFIETFAEHNTADDLQTYLANNLGLKKLKEELTDINSQFYFAILDGQVIAYLKINFAEAQTELKDSSSLEIERIYVLKDYLGRKVGKLLYDKAIDLAREKDLRYVWLGVWEKNARAINFYRKNGFAEFDKHIFKLGNDEQTDILMRLYLD
jgi:ribosomal protein S18 acetylase RimI-like enzyme